MGRWAATVGTAASGTGLAHLVGVPSWRPPLAFPPSNMIRVRWPDLALWALWLLWAIVLVRALRRVFATPARTEVIEPEPTVRGHHLLRVRPEWTMAR